MNESVIPNPNNQFATTLASLRKGVALQEASDALSKLVQQVVTVGRKGSITITLVVQPDGDLDESRVKITDDIKVTTPKTERKATILFATEDGQLTRHHPRQTEMKLAVVEITTEETPTATAASR